MLVGEDADHARKVFERKEAVRAKQVARMQMRSETWNNRLVDEELADLEKPPGMETLELKQRELQRRGKHLEHREDYELQHFVIQWTDQRAIRERKKKKAAQEALKARYKEKNKKLQLQAQPETAGQVMRRRATTALRRASTFFSRPTSKDGKTSKTAPAPVSDALASLREDEDAPGARAPGPADEDLTPRSKAKAHAQHLSDTLERSGLTLDVHGGEETDAATALRSLSPVVLGKRVAEHIRKNFQRQARPGTSRGGRPSAPPPPPGRPAFSPLKTFYGRIFSPQSPGDDDATPASTFGRRSSGAANKDAARSGAAKLKRAVNKLAIKRALFDVDGIRQRKGEEAFVRDEERKVVEQVRIAQELERRARGEGTSDEHVDRVAAEAPETREKKPRGAPAARSKLQPRGKVPQYTQEQKDKMAAEAGAAKS